MTSEEASIPAVFTLVMWLMCLAVGMVGLMVPYSSPRAPAAELPPLVARSIDVRIVRRIAPVMQAAMSSSSPSIRTPAPSPPAAAPPDAPPLETLMVALPRSVFSTPIPQSRRKTEARSNSAPPVAARTSVPAPQPAAPAVQQIVYGQGQGIQPAPEYPPEAQMDREEGAILILFHVDPDGNVLDAQVISPCPWPLLNQSALRAVRETWHFASGPPRTYQVTITFQLRRD